jgi:hypothetical protein
MQKYLFMSEYGLGSFYHLDFLGDFRERNLDVVVEVLQSQFSIIRRLLNYGVDYFFVDMHDLGLHLAFLKCLYIR